MKTTEILIIVFLIFTTGLNAQPSGGPYGPIQQNYTVPETAGTVFYVAPDGNPNATGNQADAPTTIKNAIRKAVTGDAIILRGGVYRTGNLEFNQGIILQPYQNEEPVFKGTQVADEWQNLRNGLWRANWEHFFPARPASWWIKKRNINRTPLHKFNNDMVFVDGKFLQSAGWAGEVDENSYYIDYEAKQVYIGTDPTDKLVEITAFDGALIRTNEDVNGKKTDKIGPKIKGITFTQYAYRALEVEGFTPRGVATEDKFGKDVVGTSIEHCTISHCSRVAAYLRGDKLTIRHCKISDTSTEGIYIQSSSDVLLEKNIFTRNNVEQITGYYPAAVKIFNQTHRVRCNDNLIIDLPYSNGIWYDVGNVDGIFTNNRVEGVGNNNGEFNHRTGWNGNNGFFFEISKGAVCAGNVFVNCDNGIFILNSSNVEVYQNTFVNSLAVFARDERSAVGDHFGWHPSTGPDVDERVSHVFMNNLLVNTEQNNWPLLFIWQPNSLCEELDEPALKKLDYNVYVTDNQPVIWLNQKFVDNCQTSFDTAKELHETLAEYSGNSESFIDYHGLLFKGKQLGNFQLLKEFPGSKTAAKLPNEITELLRIQVKQPHVGAYPPEN